MGFYDSIHSAIIDDTETQMFSDYEGDGDVNEGLQQHFYAKCNYSKVFNKYAQAYTESFKDQFNIPSLNFISLNSPREYNFETDKIECSVSRADIRRIYKDADKTLLALFVEENCTSRSGFWSFYSPDLKTWGYVDNWEYAQLALLLRFYFENHDNYDDHWEYGTMQSYESNGRVTQWLEESCPVIDRLYRIHNYLEARKERD